MSSAQNSDADREDYVVSVLEFAGDASAATAALQRVFGLNESDARKVLSEVPVAVRRGVNRIRAEYFRRALELSGARVEVRDGDGEIIAAQVPGRVQASAPVAPRAQPMAAHPISPEPGAGVQPKPASPNATIAGTGPMASPLTAATSLARAQSGKTLALGGVAANDRSEDPVGDLRGAAANDAGPPIAGGWGDLEPRKPTAKRAATQPVEPAPSRVEAPGDKPAEPAARAPSPDQDWALSLGDEAGPLDSPLEPPNEARALELASLRSPAGAPERTAEGPRALEFDENALGPGLELKSDPRGLQRESAPRYDAIPKGAQWKAPGMDTLAKARRKQDIQAAESGFGTARAASNAGRGSKPQPPGRPNSRDLGAPSPEALGSEAQHSKAGPVDRSSDARSRSLGRVAAASAAAGEPSQDDPSGIHAAIRREPLTSSSLGRPSASRGVDLGFWEATKLGFSGTSMSWIAKIAGASVLFAGLAQLSVRVPALGLPLLLIGLTCLLGLCSEYHRYVFWAAATREASLQERPALSVAMMMRDGVHLTGFALISQLLVWFWLASQLHTGRAPLAIVLSPSLWVLGFGPGFYWPIALACAAAQNRASGVWDLPVGLRALGRAPAEVAIVVLATAAVFTASMGIAAAVVSATSLDPTLALFTAGGLPIAISHALAGVWMGRVVHQHPDLFE